MGPQSLGVGLSIVERGQDLLQNPIYLNIRTCRPGSSRVHCLEEGTRGECVGKRDE